MTPKQKFIGDYLDKKMKGHGLPMSMAYYSLLHKKEEEAERKWKLKNRRATKK